MRSKTWAQVTGWDNEVEPAAAINILDISIQLETLPPGFASESNSFSKIFST